ncbi:Protein CBG17563 [Caenorhabditis briggsae]|uniref:Uncharacterized protein n=2 Tax=Caenorhabditis briggsae TaxID=6238 RepID=A0AAE9CU45_CAEBR|nr:Protein CBG17563 [Caenorhabditis briggsae]ULT81123.1 hypothetical protein L3Y34_011183 [Caenorhabditis briggsae]UMM40416.1 hypothetical protein L5515_017058 [Caenorhabditis briggsae]CAP35187.1 Protein CBG17563 [Caenorhabditis briggsae]
MGNAIHSEQLVCHDTMDVCRSHCDKSECVFIQNCNNMGQKYICAPIDPHFLTWAMLISFVLTVLGCASLVVCYVLRALRRSFRLQAQNPGQEVIFENPGRVHHIHMDSAPRHHYDKRQQPPQRW